MLTILLTSTEYANWQHGFAATVKAARLKEHGEDLAIRSVHGSFLGHALMADLEAIEKESQEQEAKVADGPENPESDLLVDKPAPHDEEVEEVESDALMLRRLDTGEPVRAATMLDMHYFNESKQKGDVPPAFEIDGISYYVE